ncbi:uncharacterized protein LOC111028787 [Myzus persicae]|uniref:uncharacterized protein LOC111028787 n=1 Tax=Myzus persicae TaxID=13164 RepID=UPI000B9326A0|nr:uncharacterized protein LOC111028787 [Myzus persicae]
MENSQSSSNQNQDKFIKKSRQGRRNDKQSLFLIDYMVQHPHVASGKFNCLNGKDKLNGSWEELVKQLNNLRNPGIKEKDVKSWKESWRDLKTKVSKQASALRNARRQTGNKKNNIPELTDSDQKVLSVMGYDYVEGTSCPDSWPEEQSEDVERMAAGDITILDAVPIRLTMRPDIDHNSNYLTTRS